MYSTLVGLWVLLVALSTQSTCQSVRKPLQYPAHNIDVHNGTALREYTAALRRLLIPSKGRNMPGMSPNNLAGRILNPFEGIVGLATRQTCTNGADNYCFPDPNSFCGNCGVCCTTSGSGFCCVDQTASCCAADLALADGQDGCCHTWQTCDSTTGCTDPT